MKSHATDYETVNHALIDDQEISDFLLPRSSELKTFPNAQTFDLQGLTGRVLSCSYIPSEESPAFPALMRDLTKLFETHQSDDTVTFHYDTKVYFTTAR